jgi:subfamily B ATP-binding cassette protein MsbA
VQTALNNLMTGRTVFVIAHRLSTIRRADVIAVLENGTIRESGTHDKLLAQGGVYARLHEIQFRDAEPAARAMGPV